MSVADGSEHDYLGGVLQTVLDKSWLAEDQLAERIAGPEAQAESGRPHRRAARNGRHRQKPSVPKAQSGCGKQTTVLVASALGFGLAAYTQVRRVAVVARRSN